MNLVTRLVTYVALAGELIGELVARVALTAELISQLATRVTLKQTKTLWPLVRERTIPTERPSLVGEI
jgi:hypothetical protein